MKVLVTGAAGQVGRALIATAPADAQIIPADRSTLDITDGAAVGRLIEEHRPTHVFNAAAYTAVDRAESDEEAALAINAKAVAHLARSAQDVGARFVHISTDFVFDGTSGRPYRPDSPTAPLGAYGRTKLAGERAAGPDALVVRTAWVYAAGGANFVRTMLRLMTERDEVRVVADQVGTPTWATSLAQAIWTLATKGASGVYHYTDSGVASWYDFAVAIQEEAAEFGLLSSAARIVPIATADFPTPAQRPAFSVLDKSETYRVLGEPAAHWRVNLRHMLADIEKHG